VGKLDGPANLQKEGNPLRDRQAVLLTEAVDGYPMHELHRQKKVAFLGNSAIQEAADVWMLQPGQYLPLLAESLPKYIR
jgi:hypothetical protein